MAGQTHRSFDIAAWLHGQFQAAHDRPTPWAKRSLVRWLAIIYSVILDILQGQLTLRAMSLVYTTLLSLVPLLAICFSVLKGFGVHNQIEPFLLNALAPLGEKAQEVVPQIVAFVDNMRVGILGFVGFALLFYTVVSLMQKIEESFNYIWKIEALRSVGERFRDYLSVLVVGPALIFASLGIMASLVASPTVASLREFEPIGWLITLGGRLLPTLMTAFVFSFVYMFMPNTKVRTRSALIGGVIAGCLWTAAGWLFAAFVASSTSYTAVYSSFAAPLVFMIWLYVGWLILLVGADIAFYDHHAEYLFRGDGGKPMTGQACERLALSIAVLIGRNLYQQKPPWTAASLAQELSAPVERVETVLGYLQKGKLLTQTAGKPPGLLPMRAWETTNVKDLLDMVRSGGIARDPSRRTASAAPAVTQVQERIDQAIHQACDGWTLKDLALSSATAQQD